MFALHFFKEVCIAFWQTMCHKPEKCGVPREVTEVLKQLQIRPVSPYMQIHNSYVCPRKFKPGYGALVCVGVSTVCFSLLSVLAKNRSGHTPNKGATMDTGD
jgi:hypothetical protein